MWNIQKWLTNLDLEFYTEIILFIPQTELHDIIDLPDADHMTFTQRRSLRITDEQQHFEDDHYL